MTYVICDNDFVSDISIVLVLEIECARPFRNDPASILR
jgi:hypothetical protein